MSARRAACWAAAALLLAAGPAFGQARAGIYGVSGHEPGRGDYAGRVELRWTGSDYAFVREVELTTFRHQGRPVSTVWTGRARDAGAGVEVTLQLARMGWVVGGPNLPSRTPADGLPMSVIGRFAPTGGGLAGSYRGQGAPFADPSERWTRLGAPGPQPIWSSERRLADAHGAAPAWERLLLFAVFDSFHRAPWVRPYTGRPEFQQAIHRFVLDRTDFALHRRRPELLRVIDRLVDPLTLAEAVVKANAFGQTLRVKADAADAEVPARFVEPTGVLARRDGGRFDADGDGALWTGVYAYTQALRHRVTGAPAALANLARTVEALRVQMAITGRPDEFARTLRAASGLPLTGGWVAGQGAYAGIEWLSGGNNDMFKGLLWGGLAAYEGLPASDPARAVYGRHVAELIAHHPVVGASKLVPRNELMATGVASLLLGPGPERDRYVRLARNPFGLLFAATGLSGGIHHQGICDWSGTHLNVSTMILQTRLAEHHHASLAALANRVGLRISAQRLAPIRRTLHTLAAAGLARISWLPPLDPSDAVWALRELPFPRPQVRAQHALKAEYCVSPYPNLPWKRDWTTDRGRAHGLVAPPLFERDLGNYVWKDDPFPKLDPSGPEEAAAVDYLFGYWLARGFGVIGPND